MDRKQGKEKRNKTPFLFHFPKASLTPFHSRFIPKQKCGRAVCWNGKMVSIHKRGVSSWAPAMLLQGTW